MTDVGTPSVPPLFAHQDAAIAAARKRPRIGLFLDTGVGKTRVGLEILRGTPGPALVLCPLAIVRQAWARDAATFAPELRVRPIVEASRTKRLAAVAAANAEGGIAVLGFEAAKTIAEELLAMPWSTLIVDESSRAKAWTKTTRLVLALARRTARVVLLSGCPAPNTPLEYYYQAKAIAPELVASTFGAFRAQYAVPVAQFGPHAFKWVVPQGREKALLARLAPACVWVRKEDCLDLPPIVEEVYEATMSSVQKRVYLELLRECVALLGRGSEVSAMNTLSRLMKLREVTSGFVYDDAGAVRNLGPGKVATVVEILRDLGPRRRALVWAQFRPEFAALKAALGDDAAELHGGVGDAEREVAISRFRSGEVRYLLCHPRSVGHGLTLVEASDAVYCSLSHSWEELKQSRDRIHRIGQTSSCTVHYVVCPGTVDDDVLATVRQKGSWQDRASGWLREQAAALGIDADAEVAP